MNSFPSSHSLFARLPLLTLVIMVVGILLIAMLDIAVGLEVRLYPLYFLPLAFGAWFLGRHGAIAGTLLATAMWYLSNQAEGETYSAQHLWVMNIMSRATGFLVISLLIARLHELLQREAQLSRTDALTGLSNRRAFLEQVELLAALSRRQERPVVLAFMDIDNFKSLNDRLGHARGDEALRAVANVLRNSVRETDVAARIGGDEFVIFFPDTTESHAEQLLRRIHASSDAALNYPGCRASASIGAICWLRAPVSVLEMMRLADVLMYTIKKDGKDRIHVETFAPGVLGEL